MFNIICQVTFGRRYRINDPEFKEIISYQELIFKSCAKNKSVGYIPWLRIFALKEIVSLKKGMAIRDSFLQEKLQ